MHVRKFYALSNPGTRYLLGVRVNLLFYAKDCSDVLVSDMHKIAEVHVFGMHEVALKVA